MKSMINTERMKILRVSRGQKGALPGDTNTGFVYAKGAKDLHPELWVVLRKTFTQLALPSSCIIYHVYATG